MATILDDIYMPCAQCEHYVFAKPGGEMHSTGRCRVCREFGGRPKRAPKKLVTKRPVPENVAPLPQSTNPFGVREGQVWVSVDPRDQGREIRVLEVDAANGYATVLSNGKGGEKRRRIKLAGFTRLKGRGYELKPQALAS